MASAKKITTEQKDLCRMITPKFRVSYPHVFKAQAPKPGDKLKYSITMLFPKDSKMEGTSPDGEPRTIAAVIRNAKIAKFGSKENWPVDLLSPVTDGDDPKHATKDGYKGHWVIKATTNEDTRPGVVDENMVPISESSQFYPGCYARAYVYAYVYEYMGKQGVSFILDHVQKMSDGKAFGGKKPVEQVFSPLGGATLKDVDGDNDDLDFK